MADPRYHELLGIDPEIETPPDYFQLLGVDYEENDEDIIAKNFKTLMTKIQHIKGAKHKGFIELLKDDLRKAKLTLSKKERRTKYLVEIEEKKNADKIEDFKKEVKPLFMLGEISKTIFDKLIEKGQALNLSAEQAERIIDQLAEAEGVAVKKVEEVKAEPEPEPEKAFPVDQSDPQMVQPHPSTSSPPPNLPNNRPGKHGGQVSGRHPVHRPPPSRRTSSERLIRPPIAPMAPIQRPSTSGRRPIAPPQEADVPNYQRPSGPPPGNMPRPPGRPDNRVPVGQFPNQQPIGGIKTGKDRFAEFYGNPSGTGAPPPAQNYQNLYNPGAPQNPPSEYNPMNRPNITTGRDRFANFYGQQAPATGYPAQNEPVANPQSNFPAMYGSGPTGVPPNSPPSAPPNQQYGNMYGSNEPAQNPSASGRMPAQYNAMPSAPPGPSLADRINQDPSYRRKLKEVLDTFNRGAKSIKMGYKAHSELAWYFPPKNKKRDSITYQINGVGYDKIFDIEMKMYREAQRFFEKARKLSKEHNVREGLPLVFSDRLEKGIRSLRTYQESGREIKVRLMGSVAKAEQIRIWSDFLRELRSPEFAEPLEIRE